MSETLDDSAAAVARLRAAKGFVFDLDGTLALGDRNNRRLAPRPGAVELLRWLDTHDRPFVIYTNGTVRTPAQYVPRLRAMGFPVSPERVMTPSTVAADILPRRGHRKVLTLGAEGVWRPLQDAGLEIVRSPNASRVDAVWVGWYREFGMPDIEAAVAAIEDGARLYSASGAPYFSTAEGRVLGTSMVICGALEAVTGQRPIILGKPSPEGVACASRLLGADLPDMVIMGDDLRLEITMARRDGCLGVFTDSGLGGVDPGSVPPEHEPHLWVKTPAELLAMLEG